jgi:hypothetical protein
MSFADSGKSLPLSSPIKLKSLDTKEPSTSVPVAAMFVAIIEPLTVTGVSAETPPPFAVI